jgi:hypothetical protein
MPPTIVARPIRVKRLFRLHSCAHATTDLLHVGIHQRIGSLGLSRTDLSRLRTPLTTNTRANRGVSPSVDGGG